MSRLAAKTVLRVNEVYKMLVAGIGRPEVVRLCNEKYSWDLSARQVDRLIAYAKERLEEEAKIIRGVERGKALARFEVQYLKADRREDHRGAMIAADKIVDLFALREQKRIEVSGPDGGPIVVTGALRQLEDEIVAGIVARAAPDDQG